jgi:low affinity Fe/Cu permease
MNNIYRKFEARFEKLASVASAVLGNSITFLIALSLVIFWLSNKEFYKENIHDAIRDVLGCVTFLSLFIIQKSFNRFTASLHLKVNELVASQDTASNHVINAEERSEHELSQLSKEYSELAGRVKNAEENKS